MMLDALACWGIAGGIKVSCSGGSPLVLPLPLLREVTVVLCSTTSRAVSDTMQVY